MYNVCYKIHWTHLKYVVEFQVQEIKLLFLQVPIIKANVSSYKVTMYVCVQSDCNLF